ncbi:PREDICTED: uncharacterized protein LOC108554775, partial [Eufriesea mexicana]|uniref:uncharacterized protein LOC108554775 n=1 Tax=Eufriesea mexicana TaxID=516756 RepID=UPI00083C6FE0
MDKELCQISYILVSISDTSVDKKTKKEATPRSKKDTRLKTSAATCSVKDEVFDTSIPVVKLPKNISKTFPKMSPSRKIQNINLVFPPNPRIEFSKNLEDDEYNNDVMNKTFVVQNQPIDANVTTDSTSNDYNITMESTQNEKDMLESEIWPIFPRTPLVETSFQIRTTSTPKFSPANFFSSSILEESPIMKNIPSKNILEKSSFFENISRSTNLSDNTASEFESTSRSRRRLSQNVLEKAFIFEASSKVENNSLACKKTPLEAKKKNIRSIDPIMFEKTDVNLSVPRTFSTVRDMVKKIEVSKKSNSIREKEVHIDAKESPVTIDGKKSNFNKKILNFFAEERKSQSPYSKFLNSKRKSMELENVVKSKQPQHEKSLVRGIIETLMEKLSKPSLRRENRNVGINQNFVKQLVRALEKEDTTEVENSLSERTSVSEEGSFSESETKVSITSASPKD